MKHLKAGRKLGVLPHHREAMLRSLALALIEKDGIQTTPARAKEVRWYAERVVTLAKRGDVSGRRRIVQLLGSSQNQPGKPNRVRTAIERIYTDLVPRFKTRPGGYTQILRLAINRPGDNAQQCIIRYLPEETGAGKGKGKVKGKLAKTAEKEVKTKGSEKKGDKGRAVAEVQDKPLSKSAKPKEKPEKATAKE